MKEGDLITIIAFVALLIFLYLVFYFIPLGLWFTAYMAKVKISLVDLFRMKMRKTPPALMVSSLIMTHKAGVPIPVEKLEATYITGGKLENIVNGMVYAKMHMVELSFEEAVQMDRNNLDIVSELKLRNL